MHSRQSADDILKGFNRRDSAAFGEVYSIFYDELTYFAARLYSRTSVVASDAVQDAFLYLWQHGDLKFKGLPSVRSYLYIVIKNLFLNYTSRLRHAGKYLEHISAQEDWIVTQMVEGEVYSSVGRTLELLPEDCARVFAYHIEGWNAREIARELNISERTVYNKQAKAVEILKDKLPKEDLLSFLLLIGGNCIG